MNIDLHFHLPLWSIPLLLIILLEIFYTEYIAAINIYYAWKDLATWVRVVTSPKLAGMLLLDATIQVTLATALFLDPPQEWMVTQRLQRYRDGPESTRKDIATVICTQALNPFDPTKKHC